jgi:hypothetical protein
VIVGKCPSCEAKPAQVKYRGFIANQHIGSGTLQCVSYTCSKCDAILGVETDPLALMADLTERIATRLGAKSR